MTCLYLRESDIASLVGVADAIDVLSDAFTHLSNADATNIPRQRLKAEGIMQHTLTASDHVLGIIGWKIYTTRRDAAIFRVGINSISTGELICLCEADLLGQIRTGAATGLAIKHLARSGDLSVGIFGTGTQARMQVGAAVACDRVKQIVVYSRDPQKRADFATQMSRQWHHEVIPANSPEEAVIGRQIVITVTTSKEPLFPASLVSPGTLVCAVGSNYLSKSEIEPALVAACDHVVCDQIDACRIEAGELDRAASQGLFDWNNALELADIVSGKITAREHDDQTILFKSVGLGLEDIALAEFARQKALKSPLTFREGDPFCEPNR